MRIKTIQFQINANNKLLKLLHNKYHFFPNFLSITIYKSWIGIGNLNFQMIMAVDIKFEGIEDVELAAIDVVADVIVLFLCVGLKFAFARLE